MKATWAESQKLEQKWWLNWKNRIPETEARSESISWAKKISVIIDKHMPYNSQTKILQIGPAANGEIHFLSGDRFAVDPLADFFKATFPNLMDPTVKYVRGRGEELPYTNSFFDVILIINVLDHCSDPLKVLDEINRCLRNQGLLILRVYIYNRFAAFSHSIFNFIDKEHPHAITHKFITSKLADKYQIVNEYYDQPKDPSYNPLKKIILSILNFFHLEPVGLRITAIKNESLPLV